MSPASRCRAFVIGVAICGPPLLAACGETDSESAAIPESLPTAGPEWPVYGGDKYNRKYSSLDQIDRSNVNQLQIAWRWRSPANDLTPRPTSVQFTYQSTPLFIDGVLYASTTASQVAAIDPTTGETVWTFDSGSYEAADGSHNMNMHRGVSFWSSEAGEDRRIIVGTGDARIIALNADTGEPVPEFGEGGQVDLAAGLRRPIDRNEYSVNSPPMIVGDVVVTGASITDPNPRSLRPPGDVRGWDVRTGQPLWTFETIPQEGALGNETWEEESWRTVGNTNVWTVMSADEELGLVYLPTSTPTNDWYGGHRLGDNLFAESLVAVDAASGERVWHFQAVHHGLWDYDFGSAPNLVDIVVDGRPIKAVAQVSKQGFVYVFDRATGEPVWPIEERPVPPSTVPGERAAATQPFPTRPPPFERQGFSEDDIIDFTPELRAEALAMLEGVNFLELFEPPTVEPFAYLPGALGGANWQGAAFDPETGHLYVPSVTWPTMFRLFEPPDSISDYRYVHDMAYALEVANGPQNLPWTKPPYARVTAYDLNTGEIVWQEPLGDGPRDHPALRDLDLPPIGWPHRGAPLLTRTLLFVGQEARNWMRLGPLLGGELSEMEARELSVFDPALHVFDKATGERIRKIELPMNVMGAPMTYMAEGKQYIVFPAGGLGAEAELIALSLP